MNKKRLVVTSVISIILISILFIGSTYSIFTTGDVDENQNVYTTGNLDITYTLSSNNVKLESIIPTSIEDSIYIKPYRLTVTNSGTVPYKFNIILTDTTTSNKIDPTYIMTQVGKIEPISLKNTTNNIIKSDIVVLPDSSIDIDIRVWLSDTISNSEIGKNFYAKLSIDGLAVYTNTDNFDNNILIADYKGPVLATDYIINLYNNSNINTINIAKDSSKPTVYLNQTKTIMLDNNGEYRYYGKNPNNYVRYNNELWRIISVSNVKSNTNDNNSSMRVKIVKADILTDDNGLKNFSYDSSDSSVNSGNGINDWSNSDLMTELNNLYYNQKSGICSTGQNNKTSACNFTKTGLNNEAKSLIDDAIYYLEAIKEPIANLYANDYYSYEKGNNPNICTIDSCNNTESATWTGKVGIMYPSDYLYASDLSICTNVGTKYNECTSNNWLSNTNENWTITSIADNKDYGIMIKDNNVSNQYHVSSASTINPVVYLKSTVYIVDGQGTQKEPYILRGEI